MHELFPSAFMTAHETNRIRAVKNDKKEAFPMRAAKMKDRPGFLLMKQSVPRDKLNLLACRSSAMPPDTPLEAAEPLRESSNHLTGRMLTESMP